MTQLAKKSILARLLANENISVEQTNHHTAFFDVQNRMLGLPHWKDIDNDLYDLFVGHEVGHALETPADGWHSCTTDIPGCPRDYVNIVEDIRIEKLVLRRYPGLLGSFTRGYQNLLDRDFFGLSSHPIHTLPFMDRLNIFSKSRGLVKVSFSKAEKPYVDMAMAVETWEDVIAACRAILAFVKKAKETQENQPLPNKQPPSKIVIGKADGDAQEADPISKEEMQDILDGIKDGSIEVEFDEQDGEEDAKTDGNDDEASDSSGGMPASEEGDEAATSVAPTAPNDGTDAEMSITDQIFRDNYKNKLVDSVHLGSSTLYVKGPDKAASMATITPYNEVRASRTNHGAYSIAFPTEDYVNFNAKTQKTVMVMVKEFEMRKAAFRSARARVSTKGSLDVNQLHKYKYDDHLFRQVTYLGDAQSHGMVMLIDYSGSMSHVIGQVIAQLLVTVSFCKRVGIPFEVYGFTSGYDKDKSENIRKKMSKLACVYMSNTHIFKLISSDMSKTDYEDAYRMLFGQSNSRSCYSEFYGRVEQLGGTPLDSSLLVMMHVLDAFKRKHQVQKINFVTLTDGASDYMAVADGIDANSRNTNIRKLVVDINGKKIMQSVARVPGNDNTANILNALREDGIRTINYFIDANHHHRSSNPKFGAEIKANGVAIVDNKDGYDRRFFIAANSDAMRGRVQDLNVQTDMTASQVAKNFSRHSTSKKNSRVVAAKFAEIVS